MADTFSQYAAQSASEKCILASVEAGTRLMGWAVHSGAVYRVSFVEPVVSSISESAAAFTEVSSIAAVVPSTYFFDRESKLIYLETSDSTDPNLKFMAVLFKLFFSNVPVRIAHDLASSYSVDWLTYISGTSEFGTEIEPTEANMGAAIEGEGSLSLANDVSYWRSRYERYVFENRIAEIRLWNRELPVSEAKLIYKGAIQSTEYSRESISFQMKDLLNALRAPIVVSDIEAVAGARVSASLLKAKQRTIYGYALGHVCTPIDQVLGAYPLTGTITPTVASDVITGIGSNFDAELSPGDQITMDGEAKQFTIKQVTSNTDALLTELYDGINNAIPSASTINPSHAKRYANREFLIAGHELCKPTTTLSDVSNKRLFTLTDKTDFLGGDQIEINGEIGVILSLHGNVVTLVQDLAVLPLVGDSISRSSVQNVAINDEFLLPTRDYTYNEVTAQLTLDPKAELNISATNFLEAGTITIASGDRNVVGVGTLFKSELKPGDWIKKTGGATFLEILRITSNTELLLRTAPIPADANSDTEALFRRPLVFSDKGTTLSCDVIGKTDTGLSTGVLLKYANQIVKDVLEGAGLSDSLEATSFDSIGISGRHRLGVVVPSKMSATASTSSRDIITFINRSVFGNLHQNDSFNIEFSLLQPRVQTPVELFDEHDTLGDVAIESDSIDLVKKVNVFYRNYEFEPFSQSDSHSIASRSSERAEFLSTTVKEVDIKSAIASNESAAIMASRWVFLLEEASNRVSFVTKLQTIGLKINDVIRISNPVFYARIGGNETSRLGLVTSVKKSEGRVEVSLDDLGNAFTRVARIALNGTSDFIEASSEERQLYGFITENSGLIENDRQTFGINLIW